MRKLNILMVCLGNICRSPLAQGILEYKAQQAGLDINVDSAGTANYHSGERPHKSSIRVAGEKGIDISGQRARQFQVSDLSNFDLIYAMDQSNLNNIYTLTGTKLNPKKVRLFLEELYPGEHRDVPDPWYGDYDGYLTVFDLISSNCDKIIEKIISGHLLNEAD